MNRSKLSLVGVEHLYKTGNVDKLSFGWLLPKDKQRPLFKEAVYIPYDGLVGAYKIKLPGLRKCLESPDYYTCRNLKLFWHYALENNSVESERSAWLLLVAKLLTEGRTDGPQS